MRSWICRMWRNLGPSYQCLFPWCGKTVHIMQENNSFVAKQVFPHRWNMLGNLWMIGNETLRDDLSFGNKPNTICKKSVPFFGPLKFSNKKIRNDHLNHPPISTLQPLPGELKPQPRMAPSPVIERLEAGWSQAAVGDSPHNLTSFLVFFRKNVSKEIPKKSSPQNTRAWGAEMLAGLEGRGTVILF